MGTIFCPDDLIAVIDELKVARRDTQRSDTVRLLILWALAELGYLPEKTRRAHGLSSTTPTELMKEMVMVRTSSSSQLRRIERFLDEAELRLRNVVEVDMRNEEKKFAA